MGLVVSYTVFLTTSIVLTLHRRNWEEVQRALSVSTSVHVKVMSTYCCMRDKGLAEVVSNFHNKHKRRRTK